MALGSILEDKTVERAKKGLNNLIKLSPQTGRILVEENGKTVEKIVGVEEIEVGMKLRVLAGETIPVDGNITVGNTSIDQSIMTAYTKENAITLTDEHSEVLEQLRLQGKAVILVADEKEVIGAIGLSDTLRPTAKETVRKLKTLGYEVVLLTGDHATTAEYFASQVGITNIKADLLLEDKVNAILELQKTGSQSCCRRSVC